MDSFFTAIAALAAAASAWAAFLTLRDQQRARPLADRGEYYRKIVADPSVDEIQNFVASVRELVSSARGAPNASARLMLPSQKLEDQRVLARGYAERVRDLRASLLDAATAWGDANLVSRLEYQVDRVDDLAELIPQVLESGTPDQLLVAQVSQVAAVITNIVIRYEWSRDARDEKRENRKRFLGSG